MRFLASVSHYFVTRTTSGIQVHQYAPLQVTTLLGDGSRVSFEIHSGYPWNGYLTFTIQESANDPWQLDLRVPGWCESYKVEINGSFVAAVMDPKGYVNLRRIWKPGDCVRVFFDMNPQVLASHPRVDATRGCVALQRGPVVYCFENHDQPTGTDLLDIQVDPNQPILAEWSADLLGGVTILQVEGFINHPTSWGKELYRSHSHALRAERDPITLTAIPYYAWGNRGLKSMRVWIPSSSVL